MAVKGPGGMGGGIGVEDEDNLYTINAATHHASIDVRVEGLSYRVSEQPVAWWERMAALQMPWECRDTAPVLQVLKDVSFTVRSGQMLAIMGNSGSGKTSLLDVIACQQTKGEVTGEVYLNEVARTRKMIEACSAYVRQDDRMLPHLSVRETLMFVAQLKLPLTSPKKVEQRVEDVMGELGLRHVADTRVGNAEVRGVSGGERRRVTIGIQLLLDPSILFLDEPTSGLDSFTANHLVQTLCNLARNDRTVLLSIHQPRSDIFELFDQLLILSRGQVVYSGEASSMVSYFTALGYPCPELTNPCDFYVDLATVDTTQDDREVATRAVVDDLISARARQTSQPRELTSSVPKLDRFDPRVAAFRPKADSSLLRQFPVLFNRAMKNIVEDYGFMAVQVIQALFMSMMLGAVYYKLGLDQLSLRDHFGVTYLISVMYPYMIVLDIAAQCHQERNFLYFEMRDGLYSAGPFYLAKILSELPFHLFYVTIYSIPVYFMAGFRLDAGAFLQAYAIVFVSVYASRSLAMASAAIMPTYQMAVFLAQTIFSMFIMSAGFFLNLKSIFEGLKWVSTVSYLRWGFEGLCLIEIQPLNFTCKGSIPGYCVHTGDEALKMYGLGNSTVFGGTMAICGNIAFFLIVFFLGIKFIPQKPREH